MGGNTKFLSKRWWLWDTICYCKRDITLYQNKLSLGFIWAIFHHSNAFAVTEAMCHLWVVDSKWLPLSHLFFCCWQLSIQTSHLSHFEDIILCLCYRTAIALEWWKITQSATVVATDILITLKRLERMKCRKSEGRSNIAWPVRAQLTLSSGTKRFPRNSCPRTR